MSDRVDLLKLLDAVEKHQSRVYSPELYEVARDIRAKLDAQEKAEVDAAVEHGKGPLASGHPGDGACQGDPCIYCGCAGPPAEEAAHPHEDFEKAFFWRRR